MNINELVGINIRTARERAYQTGNYLPKRGKPQRTFLYDTHANRFIRRMATIIEAPICSYQEHTDNEDLHSTKHEGFTVGRGSVMYWYIIWWKTGNCTVFTPDLSKSRYLRGDTIIRIHLK